MFYPILTLFLFPPMRSLPPFVFPSMIPTFSTYVQYFLHSSFLSLSFALMRLSIPRSISSPLHSSYLSLPFPSPLMRSFKHTLSSFPSFLPRSLHTHVFPPLHSLLFPLSFPPIFPPKPSLTTIYPPMHSLHPYTKLSS